jgi:hypothetical protein
LPEGFIANNLRFFESSRLFSPQSVLVAPHTASADTFFNAYIEWVANGRPPDPAIEWTQRPQNEWDPDARPDPVNYTIPVPVAADFAVTGLVESAKRQDPADLEAARALLEARYDLKLGIWDLASNPTLRKTLLDSVPIPAAPPAVAPIPAAARQRAERRVDAKMHERATMLGSLVSIDGRLGPIYSLGWAQRSDRERWNYRLALTEPMKRWEGEEDPYPLLQLELAIIKRRTDVTAFTVMYNQVDLDAYVEAHSGAFEEIAAPDACPLGKTWPALWRASGGWGDDVDWDGRAQRLAALTPLWIETFSELTATCLQVRETSVHTQP